MHGQRHPMRYVMRDDLVRSAARLNPSFNERSNNPAFIPTTRIGTSPLVSLPAIPTIALQSTQPFIMHSFLSYMDFEAPTTPRPTQRRSVGPRYDRGHDRARRPYVPSRLSREVTVNAEDNQSGPSYQSKYCNCLLSRVDCCLTSMRRPEHLALA